MTKDLLMKINGANVYWDGEVISYHGEMTSCSDGSPRCYGPEGCSPEPLDYLGNAGYTGNWWGIVVDSRGNPVVQKEGAPEKWPFPSLYVSCTAYKFPQYAAEDCRAWVDAENIIFSVIPSSVRMAVEPKFLGCRATITDQKHHKTIEAVCAEIGPGSHLGEASMAACAAFGLNPDPKSGGSCDKKRWLYKFWPGQAAPGWELL